MLARSLPPRRWVAPDSHDVDGVSAVPPQALREARRHVTSSERERASLQQLLAEAEQGVAAIQARLPTLRQSAQALRAQLGTPLSSQLTPQEQQELK